MPQAEYLLGIDYGAKRIGLAVAHSIARLPRPLTAIDAEGDVLAALKDIIATEQVGQLVIGMPRSLDGATHGQAAEVQAFIDTLGVFGLPVDVVDETLSSVEAERILAQKRGKDHAKGDIDAMSAALILERYFEEYPEASA